MNAQHLAYRLTEKVQSGEYLNAKQAASEFLAGCTLEEETAIFEQLATPAQRKAGMPIMGDALVEALLVAKIDEHLEFEEFIAREG